MGKFFNGQVKRDRTTLIRYIIIGCGIFFIIILFILIASKSKKKPNDNVVLTPKDSVIIEVNSEKPKVREFFEEIKNYDENLLSVDYGDLDVSKVGEYEVKLNAEGYESVTATVIVKDSKPPVLILRELKIKYGDNYVLDEFVESCTDNSNTDCIIEYYQDSYYTDYSSFVDEGTYNIKIIAKDETGNPTDPQETKLTIEGNGIVEPGPENPEPTECKFGNMTVTDERYPMAVVVGDQKNNCAVDRNLWDDKDTQEPASNFLKTDLDNIKKDEKFKSYIDTNFHEVDTNIVVKSDFIAIYNGDASGLVGYGIYVEIYLSERNSSVQTDTKENLVLSYYLNSDHTRKYITNKCNLD